MIQGKKPEEVLNPKKKIWETVQPNFTSLPGGGEIAWKDLENKARLLMVNGEAVKAPTIVGGNIR